MRSVPREKSAVLQKGDLNIFTYNNYREIIQLTDKKNVWLRHDIDFSLKKAVEFAEFEATLGCRATYYILMNGYYYNPLCAENIEKIKMIKDLGHSIGIHFDLTPIKDCDADTQVMVINAYRAILEFSIQDEMRYITFHKPTNGVKPSYELITELANLGLYYPDMNQNFKYISDSGSHWREDPLNVLKNYNNVHINTHPVWWGEKDDVWESRIHDLRLDEILERQLIKELNNIRMYREQFDD